MLLCSPFHFLRRTRGSFFFERSDKSISGPPREKQKRSFPSSARKMMDVENVRFIGLDWLILLMEEILYHLGCINTVNNGINYQPQLASRISEPSTVCKKCQVFPKCCQRYRCLASCWHSRTPVTDCCFKSSSNGLTEPQATCMKGWLVGRSVGWLDDFDRSDGWV